MNALRANGLFSGAASAPRIAASLVGAALLAAALPGSVLGATGDPPVADSGDTAWMLAATALVMIMLPGLALFYGGLVRRKNVLSTIGQPAGCGVPGPLPGGRAQPRAQPTL